MINPRLDRLEYNVYCGVLKRPSATLPLLAVDTAKKKQTRLEPKNTKALLYIGGGPGVGEQINSAKVQAWLRYFDRRDFDFLFYEQRGTAGAIPELLCDNFFPLEKVRLSKAMTVNEDALAYQKNVAACMANLVSSGFDLEAFKSKNHKQDLAHLLEVLPYKEMYLLAESWGAWLAVQVENKKIRALVLDSPLLPGMKSARKPQQLHSLRWQIFQKYAPGFKAHYLAAEQALKEQAYLYKDFVLTSSRLRELAHFSLYSESSRQEFITALSYWSGENNKESKEAERALHDVLDRFQASYLDTSFSLAVWLLSSCELSSCEFSGFDTLATADQYLIALDKYHPCHLTYFNRDNNSLEKQRVKDPELFRLHYRTLVLAGEDDPVIPITALEAALGKQRENVTLVTIPKAGHGLLLNDYCESNLIKHFFKNKEINANRHCFMAQ